MKQFLLVTLFSFPFFMASAQVVSTFEGLLSEPETFRDATEGSTQFSNAGAEFPTTLNTIYNFWNGGWAISNLTDSIASGYTNQHSAKTAGGFESETYAVGQQNAIIRPLPALREADLLGVYITNSTYAYNSMRDGDSFAKEFGGDTGDDPDFFRLNILGYKDGEVKEDTVVFYLADYRFEDNTQDYLVNTWEWVSLSDLGAVDSLQFVLESSDTNSIGFLTPAYFCIDDFSISDPSSIFEPKQKLTAVNAFPNPTNNFLNVDLQSFDNQQVVLEIFNLNGQLISTQNETGGQILSMNLAALRTGNYVLKVSSKDKVGVQRIAKY